MKTNKLTLLPLAATMLVFSPDALAQNKELDMTMTVMEEGQGPAGFIQKIQLPSPAEISALEDAAIEHALHDRIADRVREESGELTKEAAGTVTDGIKDVLSIEGADDLPRDIVDNLSDDLPLLDELVDDLPLDLPLDTAKEAEGAVDAATDEAVEGARDAGKEVEKTLEETRKLIP